MRAILTSMTWLGPRGRIALVAASLLAVIGGVGWIMFEDRITRRIDSWRADRLVKEARQFASSSNWKETARAAGESQELRRSYEATSLLFESLRELRDANLLEVGITLFHHKDATARDRLEVMGAAVALDDILTASKLVEQLRGEERRDPEMRRHLIRIAARTGRYQDAATLVDLVPGSEPDRSLDVLLAREFARAGEEGLRAETLRRLDLALDGSADETALEAFQVLADLPGHWIEASLATKAVNRFAQSSHLGVPDRLRLAILQIGLEHAKRDEFVEAAVSAFGASQPELLSAWLLRLGAYEQIVALTDPAANPNGFSSMLFYHRTRALEALERYDELAAELDDVNAPMPPPILWGTRATVAWKQGQAARAVSMWKEALDRARADDTRNYYYQLSELADGAGQEELRLESLAKAVEHRLGLPPPARKLQVLFAWLYHRGQTERLLRLTYVLLRREPANPVLINNYHYLRAIHEEPAPEAEEQLGVLMERFPGELAYRDSFAVVQLRNGHPAAALATLEGAGKPKEELGEIAKAIYAAALEGTGREEEALAFADEVDWTQLAAREVEVLRPGAEEKNSNSALPNVWDKVRDPAQGTGGVELPKVWEKDRKPPPDEDGGREQEVRD